MIFRQLLDDRVAAASYLIGCVAAGEAVVVDPSLPAEQYALLAADRGLRITTVLETHLHADYISTGRALAVLCGARLRLPARAEARFAHDPIADGECVQLGKIAITALHTPGHTPEHTAYLVADTPRAERPWFVLSGDCLFVGDVGRADLVDLPDTGPEPLYASIFGRLLALPDYVELYPGHYGGSACGGKAMSGKVSSTIGFERRFNWALKAPDQATFAAWVSGTPRATVADVLRHRHTNQGLLPLPEGYGKPATAARESVPALGAGELAELIAEGVALIDVRARERFASQHVARALAAPYSRDALAGRATALLAPGEPLAIMGENVAVAAEAAAILGESGRNPVHGYLAASAADLQARGLPFAALESISIDDLASRVAEGATLVLDVRDRFEWENGVIAGALLLSLGELRGRLGELPRDRPLSVVCESGTRATVAASLLCRHGLGQVSVVAPEGMSDYAARFPTVRPEGAP
jgi:hydroxyacylglutathione hydrolase